MKTVADTLEVARSNIDTAQNRITTNARGEHCLASGAVDSSCAVTDARIPAS